jgi:predicted SnoaL-like aldol condensation-catalyzing enzyme
MLDQSDLNSPEARKVVFRKLVELYAAGDVASLEHVIPPDYVGHTSAGDRDREGFRQSILYFHNLFIYTKDSFIIEDQLVDGEKVVTRMTANVRVRETGEPVTLLGINIARIVDGRIVEEWNTWEKLLGDDSLSAKAANTPTA